MFAAGSRSSIWGHQTKPKGLSHLSPGGSGADLVVLDRLGYSISFSLVRSEKSRYLHMFGKPQHPNNFFLPLTCTPTLGLASSRREADFVDYGASEATWSNSPDARTRKTGSLSQTTIQPLFEYLQRWCTHLQAGHVNS